jgi:hypothetical protein
MEYILSNLKNYKDLSEKRSVYYNDIDKALKVVENFIRSQKLIIYGGLAIDISLKLVGHPGIYQDDVIPDFDVYSSDFYNDANKLSVILYENRLPNVSSINAIHYNSRRVRVNFQPVCDFTYIHKNIFSKIPYIEIKTNQANLKKYNGLRIVHPDFQRLDLHRSYNIPYANPPQEVILHRLEKDAKRFRMLNEKYPLPAPVFQADKMITINFDVKEDIVYSGLVAYAVFYTKLSELVKIEDAIKITWEKNKILCPANLEKICFITELTKKLEGPGERYHKYLDNLRPEMLVNKNIEQYNTHGEAVPYYQVDNIKIAASNGILLYLLQKYFETENKDYICLYNSLLKMIYLAEQYVIDLENTDIKKLNDTYANLPFFLPSTVYGETLPEQEIERPPFGYYPAKSTDWPAFDLSGFL